MTAPLSRIESAHVAAAVQDLEWTIQSDVLAIEPIVEGVVRHCASSGFSARQCRFNIPIALTEALANAILRGNGSDVSRSVRVRSSIQLTRDGATLSVDVTDEGNGFDIDHAGCTPDAPDWFDREDGRGVFLMRSLMDRVECTHAAGLPGNTVRLVLHRA